MKRFLVLFLLAYSANAVTWVTGQSLGTYRSNFTGWAGTRVQILQTVTTTQIGRYCAAADTSTHTVKFVLEAPNPIDLAGSSVNVTCNGVAGYRYTAATVTLTKGTSYFFVTSVTAGQNGFYDTGDTTVTTTGVAAVDRGVWFNGKWYLEVTSPRRSTYGPVDFQYTATALTGISIQDDRGDVSTVGGVPTVTRYGVKGRTPPPAQTRLYITGPTGCSVSGVESGDTFMDAYWEDAGQGVGQQIPATPLPYIILVKYFRPEWRTYAGAAGTKTNTITFTLSGSGCSGTAQLTMNHVISNGRPLPNITYRTASGNAPSVCVNNVGLRDASNCTYADEMLSGTPMILKNQGDIGTDAAWGHTIQKITSSPVSLINTLHGRDFHSYSAMTPFTIDSNYMWLETEGGTLRQGSGALIRLTDFAELRSGLEGNSNETIISTIYFGVVAHQGSTVTKRVVNPVNGATTLNETYNFGAAPLNIAGIDQGGTSDMSADGWWGFQDGDFGSRLCAVDMNGINTSNFVSHVYCGNLIDGFGPDNINGPANTYDLDTVHITGEDIRTKQRFVLAYSNRQQIGIWTVNKALQRLDFFANPEPPGAEGHEACGHSINQEQTLSNGDGAYQIGECGWSTGHSDVADFDGRQFLVSALDFNDMDERWMIAADLATGNDMGKPVEFGGGLHVLNKLGSSGSGAENHESCAPKAGICSWSLYKAGDFYGSARAISNITAANPAVVTTASAHGWAIGSKAVVVAGLDQALRNCVTGKWAATVTDSTHVTLNGANCAGSGIWANGVDAAAIGEVYDNTYPYYGNEAILADPHHLIRSINIRNSRFSGTNFRIEDYYSYPEAALSQDGTKLAFHSTAGLPEIQDYIADTGWSIAAAIRPAIVPTQNGAIVSVTLPIAKACSWIVMVDAANTIETQNTASATVHNIRLSGEAANTDYLLRTTCGTYSSTLPFRTIVAPSGTASVSPIMASVAGTSDMVFDYGTTAALGSTSAASACTFGQQCIASATLNRGIVYVQPRIRNGSAVTIATGPLTVIRN